MIDVNFEAIRTPPHKQIVSILFNSIKFYFDNPPPRHRRRDNHGISIDQYLPDKHGRRATCVLLAQPMKVLNYFTKSKHGRGQTSAARYCRPPLGGPIKNIADTSNSCDVRSRSLIARPTARTREAGNDVCVRATPAPL
ncbi:hypothetical protein EVAR_27617_1 [Eumeta japonica]|uniref:Uncharacterized protein n=1 Tax=Eumeta variegata TaxID=151549 RepID=A0A4C1V279_EUMVA|nr:hypothetical protein EVAR_27617_1 [Eumeta japonica]